MPSIYMLYRYPPLWKDIDAFWQLAAKADAVNILQYPPLYCFLSRIPFAIASGLEGHSLHHNLLAKQTPTTLGLYLLILLQHIALIGLMIYAILAVAGPSRVGASCCAIVLASMGGLYAQAQTCGSESWSTIAIVAVFAAGFRLIQHPERAAWVVYGIGLFFAIGSRHLNILLIGWLPGILVLLWIISLWHNPGERRYWQTFVIACCIGVVTLGVNSAIQHILMRSIKEKYRPTIGRTLSDRVSSFLKALPSEQRIALAQQLASKQSDPLVQRAIQIQATTGLGPKGTGEEITILLRENGLSNADALEKSDRLILAESLLYLRTFHPVLLNVIKSDIYTGMWTNQQKVALSPFYSHLWAAEDMVRRPDLWKYLTGYSRLNVDDAHAIYSAAEVDPYLGLWKHIPFWVLYIAVSFLGLLCWLFRRLSIWELITTASILIVGLGMWAVNMICVYYMDRYALTLLIPVVTAFTLMIGTALQRSPGNGSRSEALVELT
jgi:hypothetical protein